jgi:hypothetical protein
MCHLHLKLTRNAPARRGSRFPSRCSAFPEHEDIVWHIADGGDRPGRRRWFGAGQGNLFIPFPDDPAEVRFGWACDTQLRGRLED